MLYLKLAETEQQVVDHFNRCKVGGIGLATQSDGVVYHHKDLSVDYLTFTALESGTITFNILKSMGTEYITSISYSTDNGNTWTTTNNRNGKGENLQIDVDVEEGDKVMWKGIAQQLGYYDADSFSFFSSDCEFNAEGNVMSMLYGDNFSGQTSLSGKDGCFARLFSDYDGELPCGIVNASNMVLPATTLALGCYQGMFVDCTSLTTAPITLPATTLNDGCYDAMFYGCTSLTTAPELPATTLTQGCYGAMFQGCTSLTTAPVLPATILANDCYQSMFVGCTSLTTVPELPATTLVDSCYAWMFHGCTNLNYIKCLATDISASNCTYNWVDGISATGTFVKNASMTSWPRNYDGIPYRWTVQDA